MKNKSASLCALGTFALFNLFCVIPNADAKETLNAPQNQPIATQAPPTSSFGTNDPSQAALFVGNTLRSQWLQYFNAIGSQAPAWAKRIEVDTQFNVNSTPDLSLLTVQPLYQTSSKDDTLFTQISYERYALYGLDRNTMNYGLGYRHVFDNTILVGANTFYDQEFDYNHRRVGFGAEGRWGPLNSWFNYYLPLSHDRNIANGVTERAVGGYDLRGEMPLPYLPWTSVLATYYHWDKIDVAHDTDGYQIAGVVNVTQNLGVELGRRQDTNAPASHYVMLHLRLANGQASLLDQAPTIADQPFAPRDMHNETLMKVRRENRVIVEHTTKKGGITVKIIHG